MKINKFSFNNYKTIHFSVIGILLLFIAGLGIAIAAYQVETNTASHASGDCTAPAVCVAGNYCTGSGVTAGNSCDGGAGVCCDFSQRVAACSANGGTSGGTTGGSNGAIPSCGSISQQNPGTTCSATNASGTCDQGTLCSNVTNGKSCCGITGNNPNSLNNLPAVGTACHNGGTCQDSCAAPNISGADAACAAPGAAPGSGINQLICCMPPIPATPVPGSGQAACSGSCVYTCTGTHNAAGDAACNANHQPGDFYTICCQ